MKMPKAWLTAGTKKEEKKSRTTARLEIGEEIIEGRCPVTGTQMEKVVAGGLEVWCNFEERIVLPVKD